MPRGYRAVAHRAGNNLHDLEQALAAGVDAVECDLWHDGGRLTLRHERKLPALPVLYDRWYLSFALGRLQLRELLRKIDFRTELYLDIKSASPRAATAVLDLYHDNQSMMPGTLVSSQQWPLLDHLLAARTDLRIFYSIGREREIQTLIGRVHLGLTPAGTSIRHTLLSHDVVTRLHDAGLEVYAWTVNNRRRVEELRSWAVDGIISDDTELFRSEE